MFKETTRELTVRAVLLGSLLGIVLGAANVYLGLYAGLTVSASIPAAVLSMAILRGILKRGTILENNIVQTIASTGESLAAGVIFTVPALVITKAWHQFEFWPTTLIAMTGGLLGVIFMIPLRRALVVEEKELTYPEGVACAEVLRAGDGDSGAGKLIFISLFLGGVYKFLTSGVLLLRGGIEWAFSVGRSVFYAGTASSLALMGVGYIVGFNVSTLIFVGGVLGWCVIIPIYSSFVGGSVGDPLDSAWTIWSTQVRYVGVGAMAVGGLWTIYNVRAGISKGLKKVFGGRSPDDEVTVRVERDLKRRYMFPILALTLLGVFVLYNKVTGNIPLSFLAMILMGIASFFFVAVASYIVGLVGSSNSPVSGMTICSLLFAAAFLYLFGFRGTVGVIAVLAVAGVVCCAACSSGDICQDLKTGQLVGATPRKMQIAEIIGAIIPAFFFAPILTVLHSSYGIGTAVREGVKPLVAPQAMLFAKLSQAFFMGSGELPMNMIYLGMAIAVLVIVLDNYLKSKNAPFRLYIMGVAVGIYLPLELSTAVFLGGLISALVKRRSESAGSGAGRGVLIASGLIAGESLMGVLIAGLIFFGVSVPVKIWPHESPLLLSLAVFIAALVVFYKATIAKKA